MWRSGQSHEQRGNLQLLLVVLAIDAIVLGVFFSSDRRMIHHRSLSELVATDGPLPRRVLRVEGKLERGSLYRVKDACEFRFRLTEVGAPSALDVRYVVDEGYPWARRECALPDTFCDAPDYEVDGIVEGTLERDARGLYFAATQLMTRCPGKYRYPSPHETWPRCAPIPVRA